MWVRGPRARHAVWKGITRALGCEIQPLDRST